MSTQLQHSSVLFLYIVVALLFVVLHDFAELHHVHPVAGIPGPGHPRSIYLVLGHACQLSHCAKVLQKQEHIYISTKGVITSMYCTGKRFPKHDKGYSEVQGI